MSSESTPMMSGAIPAYEQFMTVWEAIRNTCDQPAMKSWVQVGLDRATEYYNRMDHTRAYIIAMSEFHLSNRVYYVAEFVCNSN
jgi:hypothetical protein